MRIVYLGSGSIYDTIKLYLEKKAPDLSGIFEFQPISDPQLQEEDIVLMQSFRSCNMGAGDEIKQAVIHKLKENNIPVILYTVRPDADSIEEINPNYCIQAQEIRLEIDEIVGCIRALQENKESRKEYSGALIDSSAEIQRRLSMSGW